MIRVLFVWIMFFGILPVLVSQKKNIDNNIEPIICLTKGAQTTDKGSLYVYWGWNRGWFTDSDISFNGEHYDFTLDNVVAKDRQSPFSFKTYFGPTRLTIPQYNFRVGYLLKNNWEISLGMDHMKYVMVNDQSVKINGAINLEHFSNDDKVLTEDFLRFEHTDGLNIVNVELRRSDNIFTYKNISFNINGGAGLGVMLPKTNVKLLNKERNDEVHLSGFAIDVIGGAKVIFYDRFFIQSELKLGLINMPDIRTTKDPVDRASQHFYFSQVNIVFGGIMNLSKN